MEKDFQAWHRIKKEIHNRHESIEVYFHEREIWWCHLGANVGVEQDGKGSTFSRPMLILKKFNRNMFWGISLSTKLKASPYYSEYTDIKKIKRSAVIPQLRLVSTRRLISKMDLMNIEDFGKIKKAIKDLL